MASTKKKRKQKSLAPRHKRMDRKARLQSAQTWLKNFNGTNIAAAYRKHFGVDWQCTFTELEMLGVKVDPSYVQKIMNSIQANIESKLRRAKQKKLQDQMDLYPDSDDTFAYIVGYTSWGFPYGVTWDELGKEPPDFDNNDLDDD